ncbi:MAG TPA: hypothetical protein VF037_02295, partial [Gemmatimonadales bacterium]
MPRRTAFPLAAALLAACSSRSRPQPIVPAAAEAPDTGGASRSMEALVEAAAGTLPDVDSVIGPLRLRVQYPAEGSVVDARDSTFLFGTAGSGDATLTINGQPVRVAPNGAWLAWVALPPDSVMRLELLARTPRESGSLDLTVRRPRRFDPRGARAWIDTLSLAPTGRAVWPRDEFLPLTVRAAPGARLRLMLGDSVLVAFAPDARLADVPWGIRAFDRDTGRIARAVAPDRYLALLRGRALPDSGVTLEAVTGADTVRVPWPLALSLLDSVPGIVELRDAPGSSGD